MQNLEKEQKKKKKKKFLESLLIDSLITWIIITRIPAIPLQAGSSRKRLWSDIKKIRKLENLYIVKE